MADIVKYHRGSAALHLGYTGPSGELTVDTDNNRVCIHDGAKIGGWPAARYDEAIIKPAGGLTVGDLLYATGGTALASLADVATGNVLLSGGIRTAPLWGKVSLTAHITDILAVANGGTGAGDSDTARANLSAAKLGANTDITSLKSGVTIPTVTVGDSSTKIANCAFVATAIAALVASSPAALDTLKELADAIGDDPNFATTMTNLIATKAAKGANSDITSLAGLTTALSIAQGGTGASTAQAARAALGLDKFTSVGDANYPVLSTDRTVVLTAALTAPRTWTLPTASTFNPGAALRFVDQAGGVSAINTLSIAAGGTDKINGAASASFSAAYTDFQIVTDGVSKWTFDVQGLARGGTGATSAAGARANLLAAMLGANSDITSLSGLTTALSVVQGGTGGSTPAAARAALGAAAAGANTDITSLAGGTALAASPAVGDNTNKISTTAFVIATVAAIVGAAPTTLDTLVEIDNALGNDPNFATTVMTALATKALKGANSDITSLSGLTTALSILQGGTGATDADTARGNLVAAKKGANSDITALSGLTTALSIAQGGTGAADPATALTNLGGLDHAGYTGGASLTGSAAPVWYPAGEGTVVGNTAVAAADLLYLYPFTISKPTKITGLGIGVVTAGTGSQARCVIYANQNGRPFGAPLVDSGAQATTTAASAAQGTGLNVTLQPGVYWFGSKHTGSPLPTCVSQLNTQLKISSLVGRAAIVGSVAMGTGISISQPFGTAFPTMAGTETYAYVNTNGVPVVWYGVSP